MTLPKSKIILTDNGVIVGVVPSQIEAQGQSAFIVDIGLQANVGDLFDGNAVTPDPDASKKAALEAEIKKAIASLQTADDKAAVLKALSDATAAVQPLADAVIP